MRNCKSKTNHFAAFKIDFHKAYNSLSWEFVEKVLQAIEFPDEWIQVIMQCITIVS